ncbi:hypothetical protein FHS68_004255 [Dyadobacter arcticus]|uniref:Uncharacterized protein n=1 Tax=Dyadobacter arcticus TaxID=1078754 RepID=A0ABX0UPZ0_9BACT|nr:hypothetical protein [Dyadobacter arcticus]
MLCSVRIIQQQRQHPRNCKSCGLVTTVGANFLREEYTFIEFMSEMIMFFLLCWWLTKEKSTKLIDKVNLKKIKLQEVSINKAEFVLGKALPNDF